MERLIVGLSSALFVITWTFLIVLMLQPDDQVYQAKGHSISKEIRVSQKDSSTYYAYVERNTNSEQKETEPIDISNFDEAVTDHPTEGVSIDTLLEMYNLNEEATPNS
ncbi:hypothetical protein [Tenuibacillus multivorans]|uniref:Uncharacterized protein n=1 Tax=Tenuibacillus multivorans TaxID=237069 RepID=A0A1H0EGZ2_9BACI|nr:hypothetical protein [Tenuibacillus multivorans]GEL77163.1 hypothetical protein TMU01_13980 [Tenuibacillus multivorans]SDN81628.1 hypothetical protein SAMN05216498_3147 [Tenuibacillus multivorans]